MVIDYRNAGRQFLYLAGFRVTQDTVMMIGQEAMSIAVKLTAPILLSSLAVGLVIAMFQAATAPVKSGCWVDCRYP